MHTPNLASLPRGHCMNGFLFTMICVMYCVKHFAWIFHLFFTATVWSTYCFYSHFKSVESKDREVNFSFKVMEVLLGSCLQNGVTNWSTSQPSFYRSTCRYHGILFHGCIIVYWMELTKQIAPPTKNGQVPPPTESRKSYQSVWMVSICMDQSVWINLYGKDVL